MPVNKYYTNKSKTKLKWWFVVDVPSGEYDKFGKQKRKQVRVRGFNTEKEAKEAERKFLNSLESGKVELNGEIIFSDVINFFFDFIKNEETFITFNTTETEIFIARDDERMCRKYP